MADPVQYSHDQQPTEGVQQQVPPGAIGQNVVQDQREQQHQPPRGPGEIQAQVRCKTVSTCALFVLLSQVLLSQVASLFFFLLFFMT